jgi:hypothetical protein
MKRYFAIVGMLALLSWPMLSAAEDETRFPPEANWNPTPPYLGTIEQVHGKDVVAELKKALSDVVPSAQPMEFTQETLQELNRISGDE